MKGSGEGTEGTEGTGEGSGLAPAREAIFGDPTLLCLLGFMALLLRWWQDSFLSSDQC